jgi:hypothetical protein
MSFVAVAIGGSAVIGAGYAYAQSKAADKTARRQMEQAQSQFDQTSALNQPYMFAGNAALNPLMNLYGITAGFDTGVENSPEYAGATAASPEQRQAALDMFYASPEYTIQKQSLDQALQRQAAAQGTRYSPSTALGSAEIAGRTFGDWRNQMASFGNMGPAGANNQAANIATLTNANIAGIGAQGAARGNLYGALGQTAQDALGQGSNYLQYQNRTSDLMKLLQGGGSGGGYNFSGGNVAPSFSGQMPTIQSFNF